jgi:hypothetical protein
MMIAPPSVVASGFWNDRPSDRAERRKTSLLRQREELLQLRRRVLELEDKLAAAPDSELLRLTKSATAQEIAAALTENLSNAKLTRIWTILGEHLKPRSHRDEQSPRPRR